MVSVPTLFRPPGEPSTATADAEISELAERIAAPNRKRPIVVLTPRNGHDVPYFPAAWVQTVVEHHADVVAIHHDTETGLTAELDRLLPVGLGVLNGAARIFWPFKRVGPSPQAHPLVLPDRDSNAGPAKRAQFEARWTAGPDAAGTAPRPTKARAPARARPVRPARPSADPSRPDASPPRARRSTDPTEPVAVAAASEDDLRLAVTRAWLQLLPDDADRNRFGVQPFRVAHEFADQLAALPQAREPVAGAIARIASGVVWTQTTPVPERVEVDGAPVLRRHDHAVAWRYPLEGSEFFLFYWQPATGPIILARFAEATLTALPNAEQRGRSTRPAPAPAAARPAPASAPATSPATTLQTPARTPGSAIPPVVAERPAKKRRDTTPLGIDDAALIGALKRAGKPASISTLRELLDVPETVGRERVRAVLGDAADRGVIGRSGVRGGVRYFLV